MKKGILSGILCLAFIFITTRISYAEELSTETSSISEYNYINNQQTVSDEAIITEENIEFPKTRAASSINATVWMKVRDNAGKPALKKYWHVKYVNGKKYQGYVTWTGQKRLSKFGTGFYFEYQFKGKLNRACHVLENYQINEKQ